jgi:predicted transcriptional regulator of viral defense system
VRPVPLLRRLLSDTRTHFDAEDIAALAERQHGVISRKQLAGAGVANATVARWLAAARLHRIHPGVYALGHQALSLDARLTAALLYGGDQAVFSHTTAAWLWSLIETEPKRIHLTVPGRRSSLPDIRVHHSRRIELPSPRQKERTIRPELPVTSVERALIDLAAMVSMRQLRRALAEADYRGLVDPRDLRAVLRKGRPGSRR